MYRFYF
jgi:hypothetical protein